MQAPNSTEIQEIINYRGLNTMLFSISSNQTWKKKGGEEGGGDTSKHLLWLNDKDKHSAKYQLIGLRCLRMQ